MSKFVGLGLIMLSIVNAATTQQPFAKYRKIEAYEIRPGILMMPRYTADGQLCEIGLERLHYSPDVIRVTSSLSRKEIDQILDELVPAEERGEPSQNRLANLITQRGSVMATTVEFEKVSMQIYGSTLASDKKNEVRVDEVIATIKWKTRVCR